MVDEKQIMISVIIPVYNSEKYLHKCIDSVLTQSYTDFELILVNDGSKDSSGDICDEYSRKDERIKAFHKKNGGVSTARNLGIEKAIGKYICFIDSDDWVDSSYLLDFSINIVKSKSIVVQGIQYDFWNKKTKSLFSYPNKDYINTPLNSAIVDNKLFHNGCPVAKLFDKNIILSENIRFKENISLNEDHLFVLEYYKFVDNIYLISTTNYHYCFDYFEVSLTKKKHSPKMLIEVSRRFLSLLPTLLEKHSVFDEKYISSLYTECGLKQIFYAIINSYTKNSHCISSIQRFSYAFEQRNLISTNFKPNTFILKVAKFFIINFNYKVNNIFFYILSKYLQFRKNTIKTIRKKLQ